jgi:hypothetical protein
MLMRVMSGICLPSIGIVHMIPTRRMRHNMVVILENERKDEF